MPAPIYPPPLVEETEGLTNEDMFRAQGYMMPPTAKGYAPYMPTAQDMQGPAMQEQYAQAQAQALAEQQIAADQYQGSLELLRQQETQADLSPLLALADAWAPGKSNLAQSYKRPMSRDEKNAQLMSLQEKLAAQKDKIADNKNQALGSALRAFRDAQVDPQARELTRAKINYYNAGGDIRTQQLGQIEEKDVQKLSDKLSGTQDIKIALDNVEAQLGFRLDDYDTASGTVAGKPVDLPGVNVPGVGPVRAFSPEGRILNSAISRVFNVELKDRSGAAVTNPEMQRLKEEFSTGKFNTEREQIDALKRYRRAAAAEMAQREAAFKPDIVQKIQQRGGITSQSFESTPTVNKQQRYEELRKKYGR